MRNINLSVKFVISSISPRKNDKLINSGICQANNALKKVCSEDGHHFQDNKLIFLWTTNQSHQCIMIIYTSIGLVHTLLGPSLNTILVQCSTQVVGRALSNKVRIQGQIFQQGRPTGRSQSPHYTYQNPNLYYMSVPPWTMNQGAWY